MGSVQSTNRPRSGNSEKHGMLNTESNKILKIQSTGRQTNQETKVVGTPKEGLKKQSQNQFPKGEGRGGGNPVA